MTFDKSLMAGAILLGSAAAAIAVPVSLDFESVSQNNQDLTSNNIYGPLGLTFSNGVGVLNVPNVSPNPPQNAFYFQDTPSGGSAVHGHSALQFPQLQASVNTSTPAILNFATPITGSFSFSYASWNGLSVTIESMSNGSVVRNFASTDGGGNDTPCAFTSTINQTVCNWSSQGFDFDSEFGGQSIAVRSIGFAYAGVSYDGPGYVDNMHFDNGAPYAVPEPSTYALMALGLLGVGFAARRRMS